MGIVFLLDGWALLMCKDLSQQRISQSHKTTRHQTLQSPHRIVFRYLLLISVLIAMHNRSLRVYPPFQSFVIGSQDTLLP